MAARMMLEAWLKGSHMYDKHVDTFEMAVAQGLAAQETVAAILRDAFLLGQPETPKWLTTWAAKLSTEEVRAIEAGCDAEQRMLRQHVDQVLADDDPAGWSEAERARAAELSRRLSAASLVLRARSEEEDEGLDETIFLPAVEVA